LFAQGRFAVAFDATALGNGCLPPAPERMGLRYHRK
jgi:hypothetical protein